MAASLHQYVVPSKSMLIPLCKVSSAHAEDSAILSDSDEECLRPSLLRKWRHVHSQHSALHSENIPANDQTLMPSQKAKGDLPTMHHTPAHKTPFTALQSSCPSTGAASQAAFSPTAVDNLFGSPAPSFPLGFSPVFDSSMYSSPAGQQPAKRSFSMSTALANVAKLQKEHTQLVQQLKVRAQWPSLPVTMYDIAACIECASICRSAPATTHEPLALCKDAMIFDVESASHQSSAYALTCSERPAQLHSQA